MTTQSSHRSHDSLSLSASDDYYIEEREYYQEEEAMRVATSRRDTGEPDEEAQKESAVPDLPSDELIPPATKGSSAPGPSRAIRQFEADDPELARLLSAPVQALPPAVAMPPAVSDVAASSSACLAEDLELAWLRALGGPRSSERSSARSGTPRHLGCEDSAFVEKSQTLGSMDPLAERAQAAAMVRVGSSLTELRKASMADAEQEARDMRDMRRHSLETLAAGDGVRLPPSASPGSGSLTNSMVSSMANNSSAIGASPLGAASSAMGPAAMGVARSRWPHLFSAEEDAHCNHRSPSNRSSVDELTSHHSSAAPSHSSFDRDAYTKQLHSTFVRRREEAAMRATEIAAPAPAASPSFRLRPSAERDGVSKPVSSLSASQTSQAMLLGRPTRRAMPPATPLAEELAAYGGLGGVDSEGRLTGHGGTSSISSLHALRAARAAAAALAETEACLGPFDSPFENYSALMPRSGDMSRTNTTSVHSKGLGGGQRPAKPTRRAAAQASQSEAQPEAEAGRRPGGYGGSRQPAGPLLRRAQAGAM